MAVPDHAPTGAAVAGTGPPRARTAVYALAGAAGTQARAAFRVLAAAVIGGMLVLSHDKDPTAAATLVPLFGGLYVLVSTIVAWPRQRSGRTAQQAERAAVVRALLDVVVICGVALSVDRPRMAVLMILCAVPLGYGLTLPASAVAMLTAAGVAGALVVWGIAPSIGAAELSEGSLLLLSFALAWCGLIACLIAIERERRAQRIRKLSESVRDMLRQAMHAESNERARVADLLHDDVLQLLLATRHDISEAIDGDLSLLPDARAGIEAATRRLRETIVALRDESPDDQGLGDGLRAVSEDATALRGVSVSMSIDAAVESHPHPVLVSVVRDLFRDAESASAATQIAIRVTRAGDDLDLQLRHHDPRHALGLEPTPESAAVLHDVTARITAVDGTLDVAHSPTGERTVTIRVPVRSERPDAATSDPPAPTIPLRRSLRSRSSTDQPSQKLG
jgi:two-component system, NarL family, sensor kinase